MVAMVIYQTLYLSAHDGDKSHLPTSQCITYICTLVISLDQSNCSFQKIMHLLVGVEVQLEDV